MPVVDAIQHSRERFVNSLAQRVVHEVDRAGNDLPRWPRRESYMDYKQTHGGNAHAREQRRKQHLFSSRSTGHLQNTGAQVVSPASNRDSARSRRSFASTYSTGSVRRGQRASTRIFEQHDTGGGRLTHAASSMLHTLSLPESQLPGVRPAMHEPPVRWRGCILRGLPRRVAVCVYVRAHCCLWRCHQRRGASDHVVKPMANTAMFQRDSARFARLPPTTVGDHAKQLRITRMHNRAAKSRAAQQRIQDTYEKEQRAREEAERRRIASKSKQQLRYMVATLGVGPSTDAGYNPVVDAVIS